MSLSSELNNYINNNLGKVDINLKELKTNQKALTDNADKVS